MPGRYFPTTKASIVVKGTTTEKPPSKGQKPACPNPVRLIELPPYPHFEKRVRVGEWGELDRLISHSEGDLVALPHVLPVRVFISLDIASLKQRKCKATTQLWLGALIERHRPEAA
jgi:hypothetical protein